MGTFNVVLSFMFSDFACRQLGKYYSYKNNNASEHFPESHGLMEYEPSEENRKYRFHAHNERSNGGIRCSLPQNLERISNTAGKDTGVQYRKSGFPNSSKRRRFENYSQEHRH